ncbi:ABC transporter type 1, transmembrane domain-containing protein, partial [Thamnocephalis sphaerospora]
SSLLGSLFATFRADLLRQLLYAFFWSVFMYSPPFFLNRLLSYVADQRSGTLASAHMDAIGLLVGTLLMSACLQQAAFYGQHIAIRARAILSSVVFEKCLRRRACATVPETAERSEPSDDLDDLDDQDDAAVRDSGSITNLLNVDVKNISEALSYTHLFVGSGIQILIALTFLSFLLGWATACGIASMIPVYLASRYVGRNFTQVMARLLKSSDKRLSVVSEVMQTIRIIKLFAWEPQFRERIMAARDAELQVLWRRMMMFIAFMAISMGGPVLIMVVTLGAYTAVFEQPLTASVAFTTVALFNSLRRAVEQVPEMLFWLLQCRVSAGRIEIFLAEEEARRLERGQTADSPSAGPSGKEDALGFEHAQFRWTHAMNVSDDGQLVLCPDTVRRSSISGGFTLSNLNVLFPIGKLSVIAGPTGSGKTSLLMALLGGKQARSF